MKISLITINYNNSDGLVKTLSSVVAQISNPSTPFFLEHIVVDGNSSDGSLSDSKELLERLNSKIITSKPLGVYNAINEGVKSATGDIVGLLHAGDSLAEPTILSEISHIFSSSPEIDFIWGNVEIGNRSYRGLKNYSRNHFRIGLAPPHPSLYIRKQAVESAGFYNENLKIAADFEYFIRLFGQKDLKGCFFNKTIAVMQPGGMSQNLKNRLWHNNTERLKALRHNNIRSNRLLLLFHYPFVIKQYLHARRRNKQT